MRISNIFEDADKLICIAIIDIKNINMECLDCIETLSWKQYYW